MHKNIKRICAKYDGFLTVFFFLIIICTFARNDYVNCELRVLSCEMKKERESKVDNAGTENSEFKIEKLQNRAENRKCKIG